MERDKTARSSPWSEVRSQDLTNSLLQQRRCTLVDFPCPMNTKIRFVGQICCAVTHSYPGMIVARFFVGCGSSVFSTMVGGIISDLYHAQDRNTPMALFSGGALL